MSPPVWAPASADDLSCRLTDNSSEPLRTPVRRPRCPETTRDSVGPAAHHPSSSASSPDVFDQLLATPPPRRESLLDPARYVVDTAAPGTTAAALALTPETAEERAAWEVEREGLERPPWLRSRRARSPKVFGEEELMLVRRGRSRCTREPFELYCMRPWKEIDARTQDDVTAPQDHARTGGDCVEDALYDEFEPLGIDMTPKRVKAPSSNSAQLVVQAELKKRSQSKGSNGELHKKPIVALETNCSSPDLEPQKSRTNHSKQPKPQSPTRHPRIAGRTNTTRKGPDARNRPKPTTVPVKPQPSKHSALSPPKKNSTKRSPPPLKKSLKRDNAVPEKRRKKPRTEKNEPGSNLKVKQMLEDHNQKVRQARQLKQSHAAPSTSEIPRVAAAKPAVKPAPLPSQTRSDKENEPPPLAGAAAVPPRGKTKKAAEPEASRKRRGPGVQVESQPMSEAERELSALVEKHNKRVGQASSSRKRAR